MNRFKPLILLLCMPLLGGCPQVNNIRILEDNPADLETLMAEHEYMRVYQLTGKHPELDSAELRARLQRSEREYERAVMAEAGKLEEQGDLHGSVRILSDALQKMPRNIRLRDRRNAVEQRRVETLRKNERKMLLVRGRYLASELSMYEENAKLEPPGLIRQLEHENERSDAGRVADKLMEHTRYAMDQGDLSAAMECIELSRRLKDTDTARELQSELQVIRTSLEKSTQQKATIKKARIKRKQDIRHKELTEKLLVEVREALKSNRLLDAREAYLQIPSTRVEDSEVQEIKANLDLALDARVDQLITSGDALYRAEKINPALKVWNEALSLSPDNQQIRERTERANKVLARLEELKRRQH
ncbi:MAG: hypothetical protein R3308_01115 [Thiohalobacterales bacterium]|nr:hypothetical protein [Thiohalobacterales bacterium]